MVAQAIGQPRAATPPPLNDAELRQFALLRRFGTLGALLLACGSLGAGAAPVLDPARHIPVLALFSRLPSVALACSFTGLGVVVVAWLWLGRFTRPGSPRSATLRQLRRVQLLWTAPLVFVPPMFSRDVYSYLAQSKIFSLGIDPYRTGPADALGAADSLTRNVSHVWQHTPAPYGPAFLAAGRAITWLAGGDDVIAAALLHRALELIGVALIVWALPRLARRFGVQPVSALWLGAANPLVLFHLVAGAHNEAIMIGCMLAGVEIALAGGPPAPLPRAPTPSLNRTAAGHFIAGAVLISIGAAVKFTALVGLGFLGVYLARRFGGSWRRLAQFGGLSVVVAGAVIAGFSSIGGLGFGWIATAVRTPGTIKTLFAPMTDLGALGGQIGVMLGMGDHTDSMIEALREFGMVASVCIVLVVLLQTFRGRLQPLVGIGLALASIVFFGASVQPWYLLWAIVPLAAGVGTPRFRRYTALVITVAALLSPMPTGSSFSEKAFVLPESIAFAVVTVAMLAWFLRHRIPVFGSMSRRES